MIGTVNSKTSSYDDLKNTPVQYINNKITKYTKGSIKNNYSKYKNSEIKIVSDYVFSPGNLITSGDDQLGFNILKNFNFSDFTLINSTEDSLDYYYENLILFKYQSYTDITVKVQVRKYKDDFLTKHNIKNPVYSLVIVDGSVSSNQEGIYYIQCAENDTNNVVSALKAQTNHWLGVAYKLKTSTYGTLIIDSLSESDIWKDNILLNAYYENVDNIIYFDDGNKLYPITGYLDNNLSIQGYYESGTVLPTKYFNGKDNIILDFDKNSFWLTNYSGSDEGKITVNAKNLSRYSFTPRYASTIYGDLNSIYAILDQAKGNIIGNITLKSPVVTIITDTYGNSKSFPIPVLLKNMIISKDSESHSILTLAGDYNEFYTSSTTTSPAIYEFKYYIKFDLYSKTKFGYISVRGRTSDKSTYDVDKTEIITDKSISDIISIPTDTIYYYNNTELA